MANETNPEIWRSGCDRSITSTDDEERGMLECFHADTQGVFLKEGSRFYTEPEMLSLPFELWEVMYEDEL
ncbi:MAG: hypothetical protein V4438_03630 [Patescibacteria group bacterium]